MDDRPVHIKFIAYSLGFISFVLCVYILMALKDILIPVTIAIFLTYLFHPLVNKLQERYKIPKWASLILLLLVMFMLYYLLGLILISQFSGFPEKLKLYAENLSGFISNILEPFDLTLQELSSMLNIDIQTFNVNTVFEQLFKAGVIQNLFNSFSSFLGDFFISMIFWVFMIMGKEQFEQRLKIAFSERKKILSENIERIDSQLQSYIIIKTILSFATAVIATIILIIFGIDFAIVWGLLTFVLNYIPNIGSLLATIAPIIVGLMEYGLGWTTISLSALLLINQNVIGNFIEPNYLGRHMDLSPVFVLFSLIFWGWVWGIVGMFLAVPIAAAMKILFSNIEPLKPIAILMGRRPEPIKAEE